jgi:hypothetical protein
MRRLRMVILNWLLKAGPSFWKSIHETTPSGICWQLLMYAIGDLVVECDSQTWLPPSKPKTLTLVRFSVVMTGRIESI